MGKKLTGAVFVPGVSAYLRSQTEHGLCQEGIGKSEGG